MKLLKTILFTLVMTLLMSLQNASAAQANMVSFGVDKNVYAKMSEDQRNKLIQKIQELNEFIETNIKTKIPSDILNLTDFKIKISFTDKAGRDGLFVPKEEGEHEHKITLQLVQVYSSGIKALLAHEIFHAIHFEINPNEAAWVREGMAQVFEYMTTGELNGRNLSAAVSNPLTPLLGTYDVDNSDPAQYGHNQLYFYYLYSHCGKENLFWKLAAGKNENGEKGSFLIDTILAEMKSTKLECKDFSESAIAFEVAKVNNKYQYDNDEAKELYFLYPSSITPALTKTNSAQELKIAIENLPVLSSLRMPLKKFNEQNGECKNCAIYFAENDFPYNISESIPKTPSQYDVILVKLRRN